MPPWRITYQSLKKMTLAELRDIAKDVQHDAVQGFTQMNKDHLLPALCTALGIDAHEHHAAHGEESSPRARACASSDRSGSRHSSRVTTRRSR